MDIDLQGLTTGFHDNVICELHHLKDADLGVLLFPELSPPRPLPTSPFPAVLHGTRGLELQLANENCTLFSVLQSKQWLQESVGLVDIQCGPREEVGAFPLKNVSDLYEEEKRV